MKDFNTLQSNLSNHFIILFYCHMLTFSQCFKLSKIYTEDIFCNHFCILEPTQIYRFLRTRNIIAVSAFLGILILLSFEYFVLLGKISNL